MGLETDALLFEGCRLWPDSGFLAWATTVPRHSQTRKTTSEGGGVITTLTLPNVEIQVRVYETMGSSVCFL